MDESQKLETLITYLTEQVKDVTDFASEQDPLVAREIVAWEFWSNVGIASACLVVALALLVCCKIAWTRIGDIAPDDDVFVMRLFLCIVFAVVISLPSFQFALSASYAIKASVSPRLVILDYIRSDK